MNRREAHAAFVAERAALAASMREPGQAEGDYERHLRLASIAKDPSRSECVRDMAARGIDPDAPKPLAPPPKPPAPDGPPSRFDAEIDKLTTAMLRAAEKIRSFERRTPDGVCCPSCFWGRELGELYRAQERRAAWLRNLLGKRAWPSDAEFVEGLRIGAWP